LKRLAIALGLVALAAILLLLLTRPSGLSSDIFPAHVQDLSNGELLFHAGGCASCHSSTDADSESPVLGGGLAMETPFGTFRVPNISPDPDYGIGEWTLSDFITAMRLGSSPDGRHYYPAFPYASYSRMSFEDLMDLKSYLDTLPRAQNHNEAHELKFPWNIRAGIGLWKILNLDPSAVISMPPDNRLLARGRYLVEGPGHCGECHTPRNWSGGLNNDRWLAGAPNPDGEGKVPNITPGAKGFADWSQDDIAYYLESGFTPDFDTVGSSMVEVQENMAQLPAEDRAAIAAYLKNIPALVSPENIK
jgi:mono/diheme cytochrome c family protein